MQELHSPEVLTRQQLKNVLGGNGSNTTAKQPICSGYCTGTKANNYQGGTCSSGTPVTIGGITMTPCNCSVTGGNGCS